MPRSQEGGTEPKTFAHLVNLFHAAPEYQRLAAKTRETYGYMLHLAREGRLGAVPLTEIRAKHVQAFLDGFATSPAQQKNAKTAIGSLQRWAIPRDYLPFPITHGTVTQKCDGHRQPWLDEHIEAAIRFARRDLARLILLAAHTGQRASDLITMRWRDIRVERGYRGIQVIQKKTKRALWIPFNDELNAAIDAWAEERRRENMVDINDPLVLRIDGKPWTRQQLTEHWQRERETNPDLREHNALKLSFHGLRSSAVIRLRRRGVSRPLIQDAVGMSARMVDVYCSRADQVINAIAAICECAFPASALDDRQPPAKVIPFPNPEQQQ